MNLKVFSLIMLMSVALAIAQNNQGGTLVTAPIRPFAVQDTFPTAWANEIKGGPFTSTNLTGLSNIPVSRLEIGSLGYAQDTGLFHRLTSISPVIWSPIDGSNFTNLPISATNISGILPLTSGGTGTNSAEGARTNLGLGTTNDVEFRTVKINLSTGADSLIVTNSSSSAVSTFDDIFVDELDAVSAAFDNTVIVSSSGISFNTNTAAAATRTNLGLGATWLTNNTSAAASAALGQQLSTPIFLRTSSRDTSSNNAGGIVSGLSFDGIHWSATRNYTIFPVFSRDASTIWHSNQWVSVYTDAFNATNKTFGIATSTNLLSWQTNFSVTLTGTNTTGTARNVWAPEWFVDGTNYYVLVRLSLSTNNNYGPPGVGWMRALDPGTWTNWTAWTPFDATIRTDANDFYIVKKDNLYWLFSHGGTHLGGSQPAGSNVVNNITLQYSTNPFGNYSPMVEITEPLRAIIRPGNGSAFFEGPSVVNIEGPRWRLYFQDGLDNSAWCIDSFDDFATWNTNTLRRLQYSGFDGSGHGTVLRIDATNQVGIRQAVLALGTGPTIGGSWLTNTNVTNFRTEIGALATNGSAAALTNFPTLNQNTTGTASNVTGTIAVSNGGTGATNAGGARTNLGLGATNVVTFDTVEVSKITSGGGAPTHTLDMFSASLNALTNPIITWSVDDVYFAVPLFFTSTTNAAITRTNLGLGATWLTNTDAASFRTTIGLGTSSSVTFQNVSVDGNVTAPNIFAASRLNLPAVAGSLDNDIWISNGLVRYQSGSLITSVRTLLTSEGNLVNLESAATARTNLGLGATWLTNSAAPLFWTNVPASPTNSGTAGQVAYTNNYLYICISNNTWRRVQLGTW